MQVTRRILMWFEVVTSAGLCGLGGYCALDHEISGNYGFYFIVASLVGALPFAVGAAVLRVKGAIGWIGQVLPVALIVWVAWFIFFS
jgi:hypothetical protein